MYYGECLFDLMQDKKNPVNSMYLHEINIKWENFEKEAAKDQDSIEPIIEALNEFKSALNNKKFLFNKSTKNGFKEDSPIFSSRYLDDLISILINRSGILPQKGLKWGYQSFSTAMKYKSVVFNNIKKRGLFQKEYSSEILSLCQYIDLQMRVKGKRNFEKHEICLPLLSFFTFNKLSEDDFIKAEYFADMAKDSFQQSKTIIVCEVLEDDFVPLLKGTKIDGVYILRKNFQREASEDIDSQVVNNLSDQIKLILNREFKPTEEFKETGIII